MAFLPTNLLLSAYAIILTACLATSPKSISHAQTAAGTGSTNDKASDKVYLRSITALIFSETGRTRSSHGPGHQQLRCVGGSAAGFWLFSKYYPHVVTCRNIGWDGASIQWGCEGNLDEIVEFGPNTAVQCEPYPSGEEGYVLRGSCRLEYTLNFTKSHISFVHVVYGCMLAIGLFWFYYQSRFMVHRLFVVSTSPALKNCPWPHAVV